MPNRMGMTPSRASPGRASMKTWARRQNERRGAAGAWLAATYAISAFPLCFEARYHRVEKRRDGDRERDVGEHARHIHAFGEMHDAMPEPGQRSEGLAAQDGQERPRESHAQASRNDPKSRRQ